MLLRGPTRDLGGSWRGREDPVGDRAHHEKLPVVTLSITAIALLYSYWLHKTGGVKEVRKTKDRSRRYDN